MSSTYHGLYTMNERLTMKGLYHNIIMYDTVSSHNCYHHENQHQNINYTTISKNFNENQLH